MLQVTNGDAAAEKIRSSSIGGEVLPWRDVLHEGPVPAGLSLEELGNVRADFLASNGLDPVELRREFAARDLALQGFAAHGEVVLWFEHDLYDQLQLIQLLDFFAGVELGATRLSMVCGAEYLGPSAPERLAARFAERETVTQAQLALGRAAWAAFRSPDPREIERIAAGGTAALPFLRAALARHLEQYPSARNGLSRSEQQALEAIDAGARSVRDAFFAHQQREEPVWLGDWTFSDYLAGLAGGARPLVTLNGAVELTDDGRAVLAGREDRVRLNGIDRWLGGVHLTGGQLWRWDAEAGRLV
ncbi:MAG TPA: hypothetical protein VJT67_00575 [Longimicrobiaceae bacterium]|nr:hypothetical protein [Longimicrobiaceae bacterium]